MENCKVCGSDSPHFATARVLQKYDVNYYRCSQCGFIQTEDPYWLDEAYSEAIASSDIGILHRNNLMAGIAAKLIFNYFDHNSKFLDYGAGYGLFVRLMRDRGFDFYWQDKFCKNIFAQRFEFSNSENQIALVTAFELFEHLVDPQREIEKILRISPNIFFSTELLPDSIPKPGQWWYYATHEGQHISIYTKQSLEILANKFNLKLYTNGRSLHLITTNRNLPSNLFELIETERVLQPNKETLLFKDFRQIVSDYESDYRGGDSQPDESNIQAASKLNIIVDGVFFQLYKTGIARVWQSLLEEWSKTRFGASIIVLDRANTAPKIPGIRYISIPQFIYEQVESDRQMLQEICDQEMASVFISSYYTRPNSTTSVFMAYDMIPEVMGWDLNEPMWLQKHDAIKHASAYIAISKNTAQDLIKVFPEAATKQMTVAYCGVKQPFGVNNDYEISQFKFKYGISKPYFLLVGVGYTNSYKNGILFLQAFALLSNKQNFDIVMTRCNFPEDCRRYTAGSTVHILQLDDQELALAYGGAIALIYPSKYEGFGMPILEAMACGCPVITCPNSSLGEVGGEAVIYVKDDDVIGMANALCEVQKPTVRQFLITSGLGQSTKFSWTNMSKSISLALLDASLLNLNLQERNLITFPDWRISPEEICTELENIIKVLGSQADSRNTTLLIDSTGADLEDADQVLSYITLNLLMQDNTSISEGFNIAIIPDLDDLQWERLIPKLTARLAISLENSSMVTKFNFLEIKEI